MTSWMAGQQKCWINGWTRGGDAGAAQGLWREWLLTPRVFKEVYDVLQPDREVDLDFVLETIVTRMPYENYEKVFNTFVGRAKNPGADHGRLSPGTDVPGSPEGAPWSGSGDRRAGFGCLRSRFAPILQAERRPSASSPDNPNCS
jgi:hypothetical protein